MSDAIETPAKGEPMKAGWGASVANAVNRLVVAAPSRSLAREGAGGFGFEPLPANLRDRKGSSQPADKSCFRISRSTDEDGNKVVKIVDNYYNVGGITHIEPDADITELIPVPEEDDDQEDGEEPVETVIYFRISQSSASFGACEPTALEDLQKNAAYYILPLYLLSGQSVKVDLRTAPHVQMFEGDLDS